MDHQYIEVALGALLVIALIGWSLHVDWVRQQHADGLAREDFHADLRVDPWQLQRTLMSASGQRLPSRPSVNDTSVLYLALILEEEAELASTLFAILRDRWVLNDTEYANMPERRELLNQLLRAMRMKEVSADIRACLAMIGRFEHYPTRREAGELLDDTTDVQVVNSGFALASGLPGAMGYLAVQESNLSKRGDDGLIAKTPDGKWIKGPHFIKPDLDALLDPYYADPVGRL